MNGFNKVILAGNLTRDPEVRYTAIGTAIAKFGLAVNRTWKDAQGQVREEATFVDVDAFGKQAELLGQYVKKGHALLVEGRLKLDQWEDRQTQQKRMKLGVVLESMTFLGGGKDREGGTPGGAAAAGGVGSGGASAPGAPEGAGMSGGAIPPGVEEDDVPF